MAKKIKFTDLRVEKIQLTESGQKLYWDSELSGFGLRVGTKSKSFFCEKRVNGKTTRVTIGKFPIISSASARKEAHRELSNMALGIDPREEKLNKEISSVTLKCVMDEFMHSRNLTRETQRGYTQIMNAVYGQWMHIPVASITKDMIEEKHKEISNKAAYANRAARTIRSIINFAIAKYELPDGSPIMSVNPVTRLSETRLWNRQKRKTGHLKAHQLKQWFYEVNKIENDSIRDFLKFVLFTGVRKTEAASLLWSNVNIENKSFYIINPKNHIDIELPMSTQLFEIIKQRKANSQSLFVFPSKKSESGHLQEPKKQVIKVGSAINHHFTIHDLRRTFITFAESLDISQYAVKALVNHKISSSDITGGYIQMSVERLREPMQRIGDLIEKCAN